MIKKKTIEECMAMLHWITENKVTVEKLAEDRIRHIKDLFRRKNKIYFCGKLPWILGVYEEASSLYCGNEVGFIDLSEKDEHTRLLSECDVEKDALYIICSRSCFEEYLMKLKEGAVICYQEFLLLLEKELPMLYREDKFEHSVAAAKELMQNVLEHSAEYEVLMQSLSDEESRFILAAILMFRVTFDPTYALGMKTENTHYWDESFYQFTENDVIVEGGGYTGDSLLSFADSGKVCREYHLFEPTDAIEKAKACQPDRFPVYYHKKGLYDADGILRFSMQTDKDGELLGVSKVDEAGESSIYVTRLDSEITCAPTFVKMDIEGSELAALNGGREIFTDFTNYAICAYHRVNDILELWSWMKANTKSSYYMRAEQNNPMAEFVLYAIATKK